MPIEQKYCNFNYLYVKNGTYQEQRPRLKFDDHAFVIAERDFGELYFFLSSLDKILYLLYLPPGDIIFGVPRKKGHFSDIGI